jgi:hypothetical protein
VPDAGPVFVQLANGKITAATSMNASFFSIMFLL